MRNQQSKLHQLRTAKLIERLRCTLDISRLEVARQIKDSIPTIAPPLYTLDRCPHQTIPLRILSTLTRWSYRETFKPKSPTADHVLAQWMAAIGKDFLTSLWAVYNSVFLRHAEPVYQVAVPSFMDGVIQRCELEFQGSMVSEPSVYPYSSSTVPANTLYRVLVERPDSKQDKVNTKLPRSRHTSYHTFTGTNGCSGSLISHGYLEGTQLAVISNAARPQYALIIRSKTSGWSAIGVAYLVECGSGGTLLPEVTKNVGLNCCDLGQLLGFRRYGLLGEIQLQTMLNTAMSSENVKQPSQTCEVVRRLPILGVKTHWAL